MDLREYDDSKFAIAEILRAAAACIPERTEKQRGLLQGLFARLAEDRFNLAVVGRFNCGKTSLINAILATDRLPTDIVPLTSVITSVSYGSKERVVLKHDTRILDREVPISALPQYITQQGNPGNVQRIRTAEIQLPAEILRRGFYFVDTPGLGSVIVDNTLTTETFLPEADALILVSSHQSPLSEEDLDFFKAAASSGRPIFVVLNKHDTVRTEQRTKILRFVQQQLDRSFGANPPALFSVSCRAGLAASGIPDLERHLVDFLVVAKSREFLLRMLDRTGEFVRELPASDEKASLLLRIDAMIRQFGAENQVRSAQSFAVSTGVFLEVHRIETCEVCNRIADELWDFLRKYQYEITISSAEQQSFADRGGLCPFHTWQLQSVASPYGTCAGYAPLLERLSQRLRGWASSGGSDDMRAPHLTPDEEGCILCEVRDGAERKAVAAVAARLEERGTQGVDSL